MERIKPRTLSGFMELLPAQQQQMERVMDILRTTYGRYGFTPLDTPIIEASEILLAKGGGETEKQIYRFSKGDSDLSLRFDLTVPLAKYVALHYNELAFPFRRFQIAIIYDVFSAMGLKRFQIRINNRRVLNGFYSMLGLTEQSGEIMRTVDKIEKIGPDMVRAILVDDVKLTDEQADEILNFIAITGTNEEVLASLKGYCGRDELFDRGYEELSTVIKYLGGFGVAQENFKVDLTIARGLDYYTGTVYETALLDYPQIGSICSGGRYDNLAEYYTDRKLPGVGISIGVTRLFYVLGEQGLLNDALNTAPADVLLLPMTEDLSFAVSLATRLRERGLRAQLYTENKKFKAKMNYADKTKIPYVLFLGEDEVASGVVTCKDMVTGEQTKGAPDEIIARIYAAIREKNAQKVIVEK